MENLTLLQLQKLRDLINDTSKKDDNHKELVVLLKKRYKLEKNIIDDVLKIVNENTHTAATLDPSALREINLYLELLNLKPRKYDVANPDLAKLKQLINNKIFHIKKELGLTKSRS